MATEARSSSQIPKLPQSGPYLARVVSHLDRKFMGALEVELLKMTDSGNLPETTGMTREVRYLSPFYGTTPYKDLTKNEAYEYTQKSYGMWAVPPDVGNLVLCIFVEGNPKAGYYIGCIPDEYMNFMTPGYPSTTFNKESTASVLPVGEYNKKVEQSAKRDTTQFLKPVNTDAKTRLTNNGLLSDPIRGTNTSSARREVPSMVFGWSTPGPADKRPNAPKGKYGRQGEQLNFPTNRLGGSSFVMDDGDPYTLRKGPAATTPPIYASTEKNEKGDVTLPANDLVRIQTRTGHQILLHNTEDLIYIAHGSGNSWIEMTANGKIDVYAADSISLHSSKDVNIKADENVNIEAGKKVNIKSGESTAVTGSKIHLNDDVAASSVSREPAREPWAGHENLHGQSPSIPDTFKKGL